MRAAVVGVGLLLLVPAPPGDAASGEGSIAWLDGFVEAFVEAGAFQGVVLLARGGEIVYQRAFGKASLELDVANTPATRYHIASVSKPFTAAAVLLLAEEGKVDLGAPLDKILPGYPRGDELTLDHLLTHTSGIPNVNGFESYAEWSLRSHTPAGLVELFKNEPLEFPPGQRYSYSNSNYNLLAHVIEVVAGESYGDFLARRIFRRLEMTATGHPSSAVEIVPGLANGYAPEGARGIVRAPYLDWSIKTGNGSLYSTAGDLLRFHRALQDGELLRPESLEVFYGFERQLGYGWFPSKPAEERVVRINGRSPGYTAHLERFLDRDLCMIVVSNLYATQPPILLAGLRAALTGGEPPVTGLDLDHQVSAAELAAFAGDYRFGEDWFVPSVTARVESRGDHLSVVYQDGGSAGYSFVLVPLGAAVFLDRQHGGLVRFLVTAAAGRELVYEHSGSEWRAVLAPPSPSPGG